MKKTLAFLMTTMMLTTSLTACSSEEATTSNTSTPSTSGSSTTASVASGEKEADGIITMGGSTSVEEIVSAMMQVYMGENEGLSITYSGTGSSTGVTGALEGTLDVGLASRGLKDSEVESGATAHVFAYDGIAVIVNTANPIADISTEDLAKIYTKQVTNWSELGGDDGTIVVVGRDAASGTRGAFEEIVGVTDETMYDSEQEATGSVISTVAGNPSAIGYVSLSAVDESQVSAVSIDGVVPSEDTIKNETYPIQRPFIFVTNASATDPEMEAFIEWATGDAVADLVSSKGAVAP